MLKLSLAVVIASINFGFYWNDPAYESFVVNPDNRLNNHPKPYIFAFDPRPTLPSHCQKCEEIETGKLLTVQEIKEILKNHVMNREDLLKRKFRPPPYYVTK